MAVQLQIRLLCQSKKAAAVLRQQLHDSTPQHPRLRSVLRGMQKFQGLLDVNSIPLLGHQLWACLQDRQHSVSKKHGPAPCQFDYCKQCESYSREMNDGFSEINRIHSPTLHGAALRHLEAAASTAAPIQKGTNTSPQSPKRA
eukprot:scaffold223558_cov15-Tisochrysis_lutea.AAC.2